jgi:DNA-binding CsgD family transcriptional regulator/transposase-like protein
MMRQGKAWSPEEVRALSQAFREGATIQDLALRHERTDRAIRVRLERVGLLSPDRSSNKGAADATPAPSAGPEPLSRITKTPEKLVPPMTDARQVHLETYIDPLIANLLVHKSDAALGKMPERMAASIAQACEQLNAHLSFLARENTGGNGGTPGVEGTPNGDPLPDRLRVALVNAVHACVPNRRDCRVAIRCLGLVADGSPATLAAIGEELGISRERVRQLRVRGFRRINAALSRRVFSAAGLRAVLIAESGDLDWTDPEIVAPFVVTNVSDFLAAATQLTVMCCKAAGAIRRDLLEAAENAAAKACRDPAVWEDGRFDRWLDSASKAIGALARFQSPPVELTGRKRMPRESNVIFFRSEKLRRNVACESGSELRVISWLERSPEVVWFQEQPVAVPYIVNGRNTPYTPDAAVLDKEGRVVVIEVKPVFRMYRQETLIKSLAALSYFAARGFGYLLIDASGRTLADVACKSYDESAAKELESLFSKGPVPFRTARKALSINGVEFNHVAFASAVVNRDWAVTSASPVQVGLLANGMSFRPLLGSTDPACKTESGQRDTST